jgi:hypothetical protein
VSEAVEVAVRDVGGFIAVVVEHRARELRALIRLENTRIEENAAEPVVVSFLLEKK